MIPRLALFALTLLITTSAFAQKKVSILHSNSLDFDSDLADAQRFIGEVIIKYDEVLMYCDSAYLFPNDDFDAYGHIRIVQGDSLQLFGETLKFTAEDRTARIRDNIRMTDKDIILTTNDLDYNLNTGVAWYYKGGKIQSRTNQNVLTSRQGYYDSKSENFHFRNEVKLVNPEYTVWSDTLRYNPSTERSYFFGPTRIESENTTILCKNGWYDSRSELCQFNADAEIHSGTNILRGDSIFYDGKSGLGEVMGRVTISDTTSTYFITGDYGRHNERSNTSFVTGHALMTQIMEDDSLFLHADTLLAIPDSASFKKILAYHGVRLFKSDLQGRSDSLSYTERDSLIRFYINPVLWSDKNQLTGDTISIRTYSGTIETLYLNGNAFIASEVFDNRYNQIKGRNMQGYFSDNQLREVLVKGNGQSIYYAIEEEDGKVVAESGLNKVECSDIRIGIKDNQIEKISFLVQPSGRLFPQSKVEEADRTLEGFGWHGTLRPLSRDDLFKD